ncbi:MAG: restriction endonuclease [Muribaculaceae bacterium]|nr:restriction endonuclease [Muribaculaceae bacterium]
MVTEHSFTSTIRTVLTKFFGNNSEAVLENSLLIQYLNEKTKSANKGSKARGSFANLYSIYVVVEDYIKHNYHKAKKGEYADYVGVIFSYLFKRQRELPFGAKLQNHSLNNRTNSEFQKFFPTANLIPIIRNQETNRYWVNDSLLWIEVNHKRYNIAEAVLGIIDEYIKTKQDSFVRFINQCEQMQTVGNKDKEGIRTYILSLLAPNVDARLFEIVSYSILKFYYIEQNIYWGYELEKIEAENLKLYKTGRTNANDGGIDFVMKPLGRFFQVTETLDFKKYFLDIEKIEKYPITFVIKSTDSIKGIQSKLESDALKTYPVKAIVTKYLDCIEEIINIPVLKDYLQIVEQNGLLLQVLDEIILQSKVEFNYSEEDED